MKTKFKHFHTNAGRTPDFIWKHLAEQAKIEFNLQQAKDAIAFSSPRATYYPLDRDRALATMTLRGMKDAVIVKDMPKELLYTTEKPS